MREDLGVITYFSLAAGFLTGKYRKEADFAKSQRGRGMQKYLNPRGLRILDALDEVSKRIRVKPAHAALAWLRRRPGVTAPIASATSLAQLRELIAATRLELDADALRTLDAASAPPEIRASGVSRRVAWHASVVLEVLHRALVRGRFLARLERAEIAALAGRCVLLARVEPVASGCEFSDHVRLDGEVGIERYRPTRP